MTADLSSRDSLLCRAQVRCSTTHPVTALRDDLGDRPLCLLALFVTPQISFDAVIEEAARLCDGRLAQDVVAQVWPAGAVGERIRHVLSPGGQGDGHREDGR